jgi:CheY-like chemotaxis protein
LSKVSVLLVEDEAPKRKHIERFLAKWSLSVSVVVARSVNSALDALDDEKPDLLLLDMSLPTFDVGGLEAGGRPQGFGGIEVLRHMTLADISCPTIVITGYEAFPTEVGKPIELSQMRSDLEKEFPMLIRGVLHYNSTYEEWKTALGRTLIEFGISDGDDV